jgi:hypothetical protein
VEQASWPILARIARKIGGFEAIAYCGDLNEAGLKIETSDVERVGLLHGPSRARGQHTPGDR